MHTTKIKREPPLVHLPSFDVFIQRAQKNRTIKRRRNSLLSRRADGTTDIFKFPPGTNLIHSKIDYSSLFEDILDQSMGADRIILDFSNVVEMNADDLLIEFLVKLNHLDSKPLVLCGLNKDTTDLFRELFLDSIFTIKSTEQEALNTNYMDNVA